MPKLKPGELSPRAQRFVEEYLSDGGLSGRAAAIRAGYSAASASSIAEELLRKPLIKQAVEKRMAELAERCAVSREWISDELKDVHRRAKAEDNFKQEISSLNSLAKLHGLVIDKSETTNISLTHEEWLRSLDDTGTGDAPSPS
jgi:phage terminase small subunit